MNIQFMTAKENGIPTGEMHWSGKPVYRYIPDFNKMLENASCEEEAKAIENVKEMIEKKLFDGFVFEIVFTAIADHWDFYSGKLGRTWQVLQFPWYDGKSKEEMLEEIKNETKEV